MPRHIKVGVNSLLGYYLQKEHPGKWIAVESPLDSVDIWWNSITVHVFDTAAEAYDQKPDFGYSEIEVIPPGHTYDPICEEGSS